MASDLEKRVRERAYEIWESEGRPEGRQHEHWQQARAEFSEAKAEAAAGTVGGARKAKPTGEGGQASRAKAKPGGGASKPKSSAKSGSPDAGSRTAGPKGSRSARTRKT